MENVSLLPLHTLAGPDMAPGVAGGETIVTANVCAAERPHPLFAVTDTVPPVLPAVTMMLVEVDVPVHPLGSDHVYEAAPVTAAMENVSLPPLHTLSVPDICPGVAGVEADIVTAKVCAAELPHALFAVTDTVPPVEDEVAMMLLVVDVPVQPFGNDHV